MTATTLRLADLCDSVGTHVSPANYDDNVYVGMTHVSSGRFTRSSAGKANDVQSAKYAFQPGDVLYGKLAPHLDKAVLALDAGICTTELLVLRPKEGVDPRFLVGVVHAPNFVAHALAGVTGVTHPRTSWTHISNFEIPAFNQSEQTQITKLLWEVYDAITTNESVIGTGTELKRAAMRALFTKGLRDEAQKETEIGPVPGSWETLAVADSVRPFRFEGGKKIAKSAYAEEGRWPIIDQGQQAIAGYTDDASKIITPPEPIIIFGDHTRIFKYVDHEFAPGADGTKPLLAAAGFEPRFLFHALSHLDVPARGYNRHYRVLSEMRVPKPGLEEQREVAAVLDAIDRKIDLHQRKRGVLDELFKSLLHKLMTGEIRVADLDLAALEA